MSDIMRFIYEIDEAMLNNWKWGKKGMVVFCKLLQSNLDRWRYEIDVRPVINSWLGAKNDPAVKMPKHIWDDTMKEFLETFEEKV
ncbi:MAG: hypothetical protein WC175_04235 [Candidatus Dojkabacteria bacterium]